MNKPLMVRAVNLLLVVLLGLTLAQFTWRLVPARGSVGSAPIPAPLGDSADAAARTTLSQVAAMHLFGAAPAPAARIAPVDAPDTRLALTLRGLWSSEDGTEGYAIIAAQGGEEGFYRLKSALPGGATLAEIRADRVILERSGRFETLRLPRDRAEFAAADTTPQQAMEEPVPDENPNEFTGEGGAAPAARLAAFRDRMMTDPGEAMRLVRMSPVFVDGAVRGYRLAPGVERDLFEHAGLQPGDIVTSINGIPLSDASMMSQVLGQVASVDRFSLTVERSGRLEQVTIDLGQQ